MASFFLKVLLVDPVTEERFPVADDGLAPELMPRGIVRGGGPDSILLVPDTSTGLFTLPPGEGGGTPRYDRIRIHFRKVNFSKAKRRLLLPAEVESGDLPLYAPAGLPAYDVKSPPVLERLRNWSHARPGGSAEHPLQVEVPIRELFVIGHRGAPTRFPENTIASFERALDDGANGLEFDLCLTRDRRIVIFHDPEPTKYPGALDRTLFEGLPYPLVSPLFDITGREVIVKDWTGSDFVPRPSRPLAYEDEFHILAMTLDDVRRAYHYAGVEGTEHRIPTLEEFLEFVSRNSHRLRFLFFDIKNPSTRERKRIATQIGEILGRALQRFPVLPAHLVVCNERPGLLRRLKWAVQGTGETRCAFAYDASGGLQALIGLDRRELFRLPWWLRRFLGRILPWSYNPLEVARRMKNSVVSVGNRLRPAHMREIQAAVRDRDQNMRSPVEYVIHWTLNERTQYIESVDAGVNGILTDRPDQLHEFLCSLGICIHPPGGTTL